MLVRRLGYLGNPGGWWSVVVQRLSRTLRCSLPALSRSRTPHPTGMARAIAPRRNSARIIEEKSRQAFAAHDIANMQTSRARIARPLLDASTRAMRQPARCFCASSPRGVREPPPPPPLPKAPQDGTTHFGFETVAEALKEQRGEFPAPPSLCAC